MALPRTFREGQLDGARLGNPALRSDPAQRNAPAAGDRRDGAAHQGKPVARAGRATKKLDDLGTAFDGMLHRLQDSFSRLWQFSSDLAHESRTPINNLVGEAEVALSRARDAEHYHGVLESNLEEYQHLSHDRQPSVPRPCARSANPHRDDSARHSKEFDAVREFYEGRMTQTSRARPKPLSRRASNQV